MIERIKARGLSLTLGKTDLPGRARGLTRNAAALLMLLAMTTILAGPLCLCSHDVGAAETAEASHCHGHTLAHHDSRPAPGEKKEKDAGDRDELTPECLHCKQLSIAAPMQVADTLQITAPLLAGKTVHSSVAPERAFDQRVATTESPPRASALHILYRSLLI